MKKLVTLLYVLVALLCALQYSDFIVAPQTTAGIVKSWYGASLVANEVRAAFEKNMIEGVENLCVKPIKKLRFYYTCFVSESTILSSEGDFKNIRAYVNVYSNKEAADEVTNGRLMWEPEEEEKYRGTSYTTLKQIKSSNTPMNQMTLTLLRVRVD